MSKSVHPLDQVNIASPCKADWDSMVGNDAVRFCRHCNLNVHDLSLMTRQEALALVRSSDGRLCVRYIRNPDGTIETAPPFQKLHLIKRRASRLVAGAFGATLSLCASVAAQEATPQQIDPKVIRELPLRADNTSTNFEGGTAALSGLVVDTNDNVIPGAKVTLINERTEGEMRTETNQEGRYSFQSLAGGSYMLTVEFPAFQRFHRNSVIILAGRERKFDLTLEVASVTAGSMMMIEPSEPLLRAVVRENIEEVRKLLASGADVNVLDEGYDSTPLQEAVARGNEELVEILLEEGADVAAKNGRGQRTILYLGHSTTGAILRRLVEAGANINDRDETGSTPLLAVAVMDNSELLQALIEAGASLNARNKVGQTALMLAAREGHIDNVRALLNSGADFRMKDKDGWTALRYAEDNGEDGVMELLTAHGAAE